MRKNLFLVHTPFQLMNSLNIIEKYYFNDLNEIALLHKNMEQYFNLIKNYNEDIVIYSYKFLFEEEKRENRFLKRMELVLKLINGKKKIKSSENHNIIYDSLFIPSEHIGCNIIYNYFKKSNKKIELIVYDDGFGTYEKGYLKGNNHLVYRIVSNILFGSFFWDDISKIYCYQPELINDDSIKIKKIKIKSTNKVELLFSEKISESLINKYTASKIIYLDQGNILFSSENSMLFFEICKKFYNKKEVLIKEHPRKKSNYKQDLFESDDSGNSLESILFNVDLEEKILVSMYSTGCLTPYIFKDKYPYVIFLGMLNTERYEYIFTTEYFQNIMKNYKAERIFIPKTMDELEEVMRKVFNEVDSCSKSN